MDEFEKAGLALPEATKTRIHNALDGNDHPAFVEVATKLHSRLTDAMAV